MRQRLMIAMSLALFAFMQLAASAPPPQLYAAIFGIKIGENGELVSFRLDRVIDPQTRSTAAVAVSVPEVYLAAVRQRVMVTHYEPKLKDGKPVEFFTWFYFDPEQPTRADIGTEPRLAPNAPEDQPHSVSQQQAAAYEAAIAPYIEKARKSYPEAKRRFGRGLAAGQVFYITTRLRDALGHFEQVFIKVRAIEGTRVTGYIASDLRLVQGYEPGQSYSFDESELIDWLIANPDGSEEGNVVGKFLDTYQPQ